LTREHLAVVIIVGVRHVIRVTVGLLGALSFVILPMGIARAAPAVDTSVEVAVVVTNGQLTVGVRNAPLALVLSIIGERAGVEVTLRGDLSAGVTEAFAGLPLEEGIRRLARGHSVVISYGAPTGEPGSARLAAFRVIAAASAVGRSGEPAVPGGAKPSSEASASSPGAKAPGASEPADQGRTSGVAGGPSLDVRVVEIQRVADEAGLGSEIALGRLIDMASSETESGLREQAVAALGRLASPSVEPVLVAALGDVDVDVRLRAVRELRRFGSDSAVQSIAEVSLGDADPHVRLAAVTALTSLPGDSMRRGLARASSDPDEIVREAAIRGLAWWTARPRSGP
jgi:hypothetical protein